MTTVHSMEALGNKFILIDAISQKVDSREELKLVENCANKFQFDQLLILEPPTQKSADVKLKIYNLDGSLAENCVNGIRATALYAFDENLVSGESFILQIENNKAHIAKLEADTFSVRMTSFDFSKSSCAVDESAKLQFIFENLDISFEPVSVGNPHAVIFQNNLPDKIPDMGATLQNSNIFKIKYPKKYKRYVASKGSICLDGISLTINEAFDDFFSVNIIPVSYTHLTLPTKRIV